MMWQTLVLTVTVAALLQPTPRATAAFQRERLTVVLERITSGPASFELLVTADFDETGAFIGSLDGEVTKGRVVGVRPGFATSMGERDGVGVSAMGDSINSCDQVDVCTAEGIGQGFQAISYQDDEGGDSTNFVLLAAEAKDISYKFDSNGWRLRVVDWPFRYLDTDGSDAVSLGTGSGEGAEVFFEATLRGGRHGSLAVALPPCSTAHIGVVDRGVGEATLSGGVEEKTTTCPTDRPSGAATWAPKKTTWRLEGTVLGDSTLNETRLFVIDLPKSYLTTTKRS